MGVQRGPPRVCASLCDRVYEACSTAFFAIDTKTQVFCFILFFFEFFTSSVLAQILVLMFGSTICIDFNTPYNNCKEISSGFIVKAKYAVKHALIIYMFSLLMLIHVIIHVLYILKHN